MRGNGRAGQMSRSRKEIARNIATHGNVKATAQAMGYRESSIRNAMSDLQVQAEIARVQQAILYNEILPLATAAHKRILSDPKTPAGAVVQAVKLAYDRTLGSDEAGATKQPHEMTPDELALAIAALTRAAADKAKEVNAEVIDVDAEPMPDDEEQPGIFD